MYLYSNYISLKNGIATKPITSSFINVISILESITLYYLGPLIQHLKEVHVIT